MWPFTASYPQQSLSSLRSEYDFIVAGGGTAGCVLARRLSENGKYTVLLVEQGDAADGWLHRTPLTSLHHWSDRKHSTVIDSAQDSTLGRSVSLIVGRGLGGTSRINGGQYTCGTPAEFDTWLEAGRKGWGYNDLKPYFLKSEKWLGSIPKEWHGSTGPLKIRSFEEYFYPSSQKAAEAAGAMGFAPILDMHSPLEPAVGWNKMQYAVDEQGSRQSSFRAYLPKAAVHENLHVCTRTIATKIQLGRMNRGSLRAEAIELQASSGRGPLRVVKARREIILSCGALKTPQVLMLSGLGPEAQLQSHGIEVLKDLPGVGSHLQDHLLLPTSYQCPIQDSLWGMIRRPTILFNQLYQFLRYGTGWLLCTSVEMEIFGLSSVIADDGQLVAHDARDADPSRSRNVPDFAVMTCGIADPRVPNSDKSKGFFGLNCALLKAQSHGRITLRSSNPVDLPVCETHYLSAQEDWSALRSALRVSVELARRMRDVGYPLEVLSVPKGLDDVALNEFIAEKVDTMFHYSSTCRMAPLDDPKPGVVDDCLKVHGVTNLRIADASIFPDIPSSHPQALVYAVAEKCADLILGMHN